MSLSRPERQVSEDDRKTCWVCFATEDDDRDAPWVMPCRCRGTTKWVHQVCLQRWIDEKQKGNSIAKVSCPQCNTEYLIVFPKPGMVMLVLDMMDRAINKISPWGAGFVFLSAGYWAATSMGAVAVMQLMGHKEGLHMMENADPIVLFLGLPTITVLLLLCKCVPWELKLLQFWRKHCHKIPLFKYIFGSSPIPSRVPAEMTPLSDPISLTRAISGAVIFPTIATFVGKIMFSQVTSNFQRTLLGGIAFVAIKGTMKIFYKQQQYIRQSQRQIKDYIPAETGDTAANNRPPQNVQN